MRGTRTKQHRWQTNGTAYDAETIWRLNSGCMPLAHQGHQKECLDADIIIAAIGKPNFVTADMVKEGAVVIDVGTTRVPDASRKSGFRLNGDVKFDEVAPKCSFITPVPGGVGPMTICSLMKNTLAAGKKEYYK